jgi:glycosyltransferase involved in cell wall biosynthesis
MVCKTWNISVLIPAHNEELLLPRCLHSILLAAAEVPKSTKVKIILVSDSSTDKTFQISHSILGDKGVVCSIKKKNVGYARRFAAQVALQDYKGFLSDCWLANTDADCVVPKNWLLKQLLWASTGVQAIAGIVKVDSFAEHKNSVAKQFLKSYTINLDGSHPHVHGANLGIRADIYQSVGGWHELETAEDHDLWDRLSACGIYKISHADLFVYTSGRQIGRAPKGFSDKLASFKK